MKKFIDKDLMGKMLDTFKEAILSADKNWDLLEQRYNQVHQAHNIPNYY